MKSLVCFLAIALSSTASADPIRTLSPEPVWPHGVPAYKDWPGSMPQPVQEEEAGGDTVRNVTVPSFQAFLPPNDKHNGSAVIIVPGGGFRHLSMRKEGSEVAKWLAQRGTTAFVLKYRLVQSLPGETQEAMRVRTSRMKADIIGEPAADDGLQVLRVIRSRAASYGIDPKRIGVVGFSAGGHVAGMMALAPDPRERPAFAGLIYGMPFTSAPPPLPPANLPFPHGTPHEPWLQPKPTPAPGALPPLFMAMAQDDLAVGNGFRAFYEALFAAGYRPELHLYASGNHGFGIEPQGAPSDGWIESFAAWMAAMGFTDRSPAGR